VTVPRYVRPKSTAAGLLGLFATLAVSACTTTGEVGSRDDAVCTGQGFQPGSADYANCRTLLANQHRDDALVARSEYFGND
jgi:hypothetical protein